MRCLPDKAEHVPLDAKCPEHHACGTVHRFEDGTLLDM
jgi:hypothetical protein